MMIWNGCPGRQITEYATATSEIYLNKNNNNNYNKIINNNNNKQK